MEQSTCRLMRTFSEIFSFQSSFAIVYDIRPCGENRFTLIVQRSGAKECQRSLTVTTTDCRAREFLQFLYENAVHPEHLSDFAQDFFHESLRVGNIE